MQRKDHWERIYQTKKFEEVSWFQEIPKTSIAFLQNANLQKNAHIIDVGGGESRFVNYLLAEGYENITVLDISANAFEKKKQELGNLAEKVNWVVSDIVDFKPTQKYDFWHDRAVFHFLTEDKEIDLYLQNISDSLNVNAKLVIGTFSENAPTKCSGLEIKQYSEQLLSDKLAFFFKKISCISIDHQTPFNSIQNFIFCNFEKK